MSSASPRDVIAKACFDPGQYAAARWADETISAWQARASEAALTAAGYRVVREGDLDAATVERCAQVIDGHYDNPRYTEWAYLTACADNRSALRALVGEAK